MKRDVLTTPSFAAIHFTMGFTVSYALTGSLVIAGGIALLEPGMKMVAFFLHEQACKGRAAAIAREHRALA